MGYLPLETNPQPEICRCCSREKSFPSLSLLCPNKTHAANDRLWHETAPALTSHSYFDICASSVAWGGPRAVKKVLCHQLAKDEGQGAQRGLERAPGVWSEICQVPGTSLLLLIAEWGVSMGRHSVSDMGLCGLWLLNSSTQPKNGK